MKIKTGDKVRIIAGKDKGKEGTVLQVFQDIEKVIVEGLNIATRHLRTRQRDHAGQKIKFPAPIHVSNVVLISPKTGKTGRIGRKLISRDGVSKKIRVIRTHKKEEDIE